MGLAQAIGVPILDFSFNAGADLTGKQFFFVKLDASGDVVLAGNGERAIGVLQNDPAQDEAASVRLEGISKVVSGAAVTLPNLIGSDAAGKAVPAASTDQTLGEALSTSGADLTVISVHLFKNGIQP